MADGSVKSRSKTVQNLDNPKKPSWAKGFVRFLKSAKTQVMGNKTGDVLDTDADNKRKSSGFEYHTFDLNKSQINDDGYRLAMQCLQHNTRILDRQLTKKIGGVWDPSSKAKYESILEVLKGQNQVNIFLRDDSVISEDCEVETLDIELGFFCSQLLNKLLQDKIDQKQELQAKINEIIASGDLESKIILTEKLVEAVQYKKEDGQEAETDFITFKKEVLGAVENAYEAFEDMKFERLQELGSKGVEGAFGSENSSRRELMPLFRDRKKSPEFAPTIDEPLENQLKALQDAAKHLKFSENKVKGYTEKDFNKMTEFLKKLNVATLADSQFPKELKTLDNGLVAIATKNKFSGRVEIIFVPNQEEEAEESKAVYFRVQGDNHVSFGTILHKKKVEDLDREVAAGLGNTVFVMDNGKAGKVFVKNDDEAGDKVIKDLQGHELNKLNMFRTILKYASDPAKFHGNIDEDGFLVNPVTKEVGLKEKVQSDALDYTALLYQDDKKKLQVKERGDVVLDDVVVEKPEEKKAQRIAEILIKIFVEHGVGKPPLYYDSIAALKLAKRFYGDKQTKLQDIVEARYIRSLHQFLSEDLVKQYNQIPDEIVKELENLVNNKKDKETIEAFLDNKNINARTAEVNKKWSPSALFEKVQRGDAEYFEESRLSVATAVNRNRVAKKSPRREAKLFEEFKDDFKKSLTPRKYQIALGMLNRYCDLDEEQKKVFDEKFGHAIDNPKEFEGIVFDYSDFSKHEESKKKEVQDLKAFNERASEFLEYGTKSKDVAEDDKDEMWKKLAQFASQEAMYKDLLRIKKKFKLSKDDQIWTGLRAHYEVIFNEDSKDDELAKSLAALKTTITQERLKKWQSRLGDSFSKEKLNALLQKGDKGLNNALNDEDLLLAFGRELVKRVDKSILEKMRNDPMLISKLGQEHVNWLTILPIEKAIQDEKLLKFLGREKLERIYKKFVALGEVEDVKDLKLRVKEKKIAEFNERFSDEFDLLNGVSQVRTTGQETLFRGMDLGYISTDIDKQAAYVFQTFQKANVPEPIAAKGKRQKSGSYNILTKRKGSPVYEDDKRISFGVSTSFDIGVAMRYSLSAKSKKGGWVFVVKPKEGEKGVRIYNRYKELCVAKINPEDIYCAYYLEPKDVKESPDPSGTGESTFEIESMTVKRTIFNPNYEHDKTLHRVADKKVKEDILVDYFGAKEVEEGQEKVLECVDKGDSQGFVVPLREDEQRGVEPHQYSDQVQKNIDKFHETNPRPQINGKSAEDIGTINEVHVRDGVVKEHVVGHFRDSTNKALFEKSLRDDILFAELKLKETTESLGAVQKNSGNKVYVAEGDTESKSSLSVSKDGFLEEQMTRIDEARVYDDNEKESQRQDAVRNVIDKALRAANRQASDSYEDKTALTNKEMALAILIASKNGGLGNKQSELGSDLQALGYTDEEIEPLKAKLIAFSFQFQKLVKNDLQTGNMEATKMVGLRLKRLPVEYAIGLMLEDFIMSKVDSKEAKEEVNNMFGRFGQTLSEEQLKLLERPSPSPTREKTRTQQGQKQKNARSFFRSVSLDRQNPLISTGELPVH